METVAFGVIGGSGLYHMAELTDKTEVTIDTPFGPTSAPITIGTLRGKRAAFLPRHGLGHVYTPTTVPYRANLYALKVLGVKKVIAVNACGSLREEYAPGHIVVPDQLFDHTRGLRDRSFFDSGLVAHVSVADPFCSTLNHANAEAVRAAGGTVHEGGTYITIEGPRFSTRGESNIYRQWGCGIIGMTTSPEAFLAREAEMCYSTMSHITDYDVWHEEPVHVEMVIATFNRNLATAQQAVAHMIEHVDGDADCECHHALDGAIMTHGAAVDPGTVERLRPIVGRFFQS